MSIRDRVAIEDLEKRVAKLEKEAKQKAKPVKVEKVKKEI